MAISKIVTNSVDSGVTLTSPTIASPTISAPVLSGSATGTYTIAGTYTLAGTPTAGASLITSGTAVASTSGTSIDFTSIPSWVKRITVMFSGVSTNGASSLLLQIGDSVGIENTGYSGLSGLMHSSGGNTYTGITAGSPLGYSTMTAASAYSGNLTITNLSGNEWAVSGTLATTGLLYLMVFTGVKTLSGTLDRVRITTVNGTDTFDAGSINILYE